MPKTREKTKDGRKKEGKIKASKEETTDKRVSA